MKSIFNEADRNYENKLKFKSPFDVITCCFINKYVDYYDFIINAELIPGEWSVITMFNYVI